MERRDANKEKSARMDTMKNARKFPRVSRCSWVLVFVYVSLAFLAARAQAEDSPGDLDPSFGTGGKVTTDFNSAFDRAFAVAIQADGKIVTVGSSNFDFALVRYNSDGSLDPHFDGDGMVTTDIGLFDEAFAVAIQTDGKIVAAGRTAPEGGCCQLALARYNADGSLDTSFDTDGKVTTIFQGHSAAFAVAIQSDGKIVAAGMTDSPFLDGFALARYNADGSLDTSFDEDGKVTTDFGGIDGASGLAIQADGKIVVAGWGGPADDFALARYNPDGSLDLVFGGGGKVTTDFDGLDRAEDMAVQEDGKIIAVGVSGSGNFALARYNIDGTLDSSFDGDGKVITDFGGDDRAQGVAIQALGKIVAVGFSVLDYDEKFGIARYNHDGSLDTSFGLNGKVTTDFGDPSDVGVLCPPARSDCSNDIAEDIAVQSDGKIVVVGGAGACVPPCDFAVARYLGDPVATDVTEVQIDIKPGSVRNSINFKSNGVIPVAILSTPEFDSTSVDPLSVRFGPSGATEIHGRGHFEDIGGDGDVDLVLHFRTRDTGIAPDNTEACLTAQTFESGQIQGCDVMVVR